jgi:AcrR family transcriptional regulator
MDEQGIDRDTVLEAALKAFADSGYDAMSVRELNRSLGVSHNYIHKRFGSKEALWQAAIDYGLGRFTEALTQPPHSPDEDRVERYRNELRRIVELLARYPSVQRIIESEGLVGGKRLDYLVSRYIGPTTAASMPYFEQVTHIAERKLQLSSLIMLVSSGTSAFFLRPAFAKKLGTEDPTSQEAIQRHIDTVVDVLLYGLLNEQPKGQNAK